MNEDQVREIVKGELLKAMNPSHPTQNEANVEFRIGVEKAYWEIQKRLLNRVVVGVSNSRTTIS